MLSGVQEKKMRTVRVLLTLGWLVLIVSLFWDPITPELTRPDNTLSPFHMKGADVSVQGEILPELPYPMTNRIFWTMIIPLLPLFFMVAGHETWRRVCPLSFVSQIPRYLGLNRKRSVFIRRSGQVEKQLALVGKGSWLRRNVWYVQFGLLFLALNARILFVNSDRIGLACFFIAVIIIAPFVGYYWGGKTWCNYLCPIAIVQKIYTEPRGLLESQAHVSRVTITQSMCRAPTPDGDRSICVGCTSNCPDIDLERSYWEGIENPALRNVYYGFFGLIVGFYSFYYLYAGNWDFYFSGAWTHEVDQIGNLFKPGMYINGTVIGIPKILSAPLILTVFVAMAILLGKSLEAFYRSIINKFKITLTEPEIISRCLSFSAYASINTFYLFGGRPNLALLPSSVLHLIDFLIVALTTVWFFQAIQRNPMRYRREGLATSLVEQLRKLRVDISKFLEGRTLEELKPDEVYVLAKTLPSFSREQRLQAYRNILEDSLRMGKTDTSASLELLREVRVEIGVTDDEHRQILQDLGIDSNDPLFDPQAAATFESWIRISNYRRVIETLIIGRLDHGESLDVFLKEQEVVDTIKTYREMYQVSELEHSEVLANIIGSGGMMFERAKRQLEAMADDAALIYGLQRKMLADSQWTSIGSLLITSTIRRSNAHCLKLFSFLLTLGNTAAAQGIAIQIAKLMGREVEVPMAVSVSGGARVTWAESLSPNLVNILRGEAPNISSQGTDEFNLESHDVVKSGENLVAHLRRIVSADDKPMAALALTAISYIDLGLARQIASELVRQETHSHWLMSEVMDGLVGKHGASASTVPRQAITVTVANPNGGQQAISFDKDYVTVGRSPDNDVVILGPDVALYHVAICRDGAHVDIRKSDPVARFYLDGQLVEEDSISIKPGTRLSFVPSSQTGTVIVVEWVQQSTEYILESYGTVTRLLWLSCANILKNLELNSLAEIAASAEVRRYQQGSWLCRAGDPSSDAFVLQAGSLEIVSAKGDMKNVTEPNEGVCHNRRREDMQSVIGALNEGALVGELGVITGRPRAASVRVTSPFARIVTINGERLRWIMEGDASVSLGMLSVVAGYVKN